MEKIFVLIPWFSPAYKAGGPIRSVSGMISQLVNSSMMFYVFCSNRDMDAEILDVATDEWVPFSPNCKVWYSSNNNILPVLNKEIKKQQPQYLFINGLYNRQYNIKPMLRAKGVPKIISIRGMLHPGALSQKVFKKKFFLQLLKITGWQHKNSFHVTDEQEKIFTEKELGPKAKIFVAGNFPVLFTQTETQVKKAGALKLVSIGLISAMKNYLLVLEALRTIGSGQWAVGNEDKVGSGSRNSSGQELAVGNKYIEYNIYGPVKDADYWEECKEVIKSLPANIVVNYHGAIESWAVEAALATSHVFILPSKSENFGHSIIEALSAGRPVITSHGTPWKNLQQSKAGINSATDGQALTDAISFFVNMPEEELILWSNSASSYSKKAIDVNELKEQYKKMFGNR